MSRKFKIDYSKSGLGIVSDGFSKLRWLILLTNLQLRRNLSLSEIDKKLIGDKTYKEGYSKTKFNLLKYWGIIEESLKIVFKDSRFGYKECFLLLELKSKDNKSLLLFSDLCSKSIPYITGLQVVDIDRKIFVTLKYLDSNHLDFLIRQISEIDIVEKTSIIDVISNVIEKPNIPLLH